MSWKPLSKSATATLTKALLVKRCMALQGELERPTTVADLEAPCPHTEEVVGYISAGRLEPGEPHASALSCGREECVLKTQAYVTLKTGKPATVLTRFGAG